MKFLNICLLFFLPLASFADKPVQSARMGKVGGLHPNSWRISQEVDKKGEGKNYLFKVSIYKEEFLCDFFEFTLNEGAKNTKSSQFTLSGNLNSEKFGAEVSIEFLEMCKNNTPRIHISAKANYLDAITYNEGKHSPVFYLASIDTELSLILGETLALVKEKEKPISIKIEALAE